MKRLTTEEIIRIGELYADGWGATEIGKQLSRPYETVKGVLRGKYRNHRAILGGRLMKGPRPKKELAVYEKSL